jgi:two-component system, cell cycle response regulator
VPQRVLIIDAAPMVHTILGLRLHEESVLLDSAQDAESGIIAAQKLHPDLILLDLDGGGFDGLAVCRAIKADSGTREIPIIFLTSEASADERIKGLEAGASDYISKPFDLAEFKARVRVGLRTSFLLDLLSKKAMIDGLTGLWNRPYFDDRLTAEISLARRSGRPVSCLVCEIDHFSDLISEHGHPGADDVLRSVSSFLVNNCRIEDVICRFGGEQFGIVAPNTNRRGASDLATRLVGSIAHTDVICRGSRIRITCSFGLAEWQGAEAQPIVELAQQALAKAKQAGGNKFEFAASLPALAH